MVEHFNNKNDEIIYEINNDINTESRIVRFFSHLTICLFCGLIGAGCVTGIVFLCKTCYNIIWGG